MTKKSRERKKTVRKVKRIINTELNETAINFITEIFKLENREIPKFEKLNNDEILKIYGKTHNELNDKLMRHRHKPIDVEYLDELRYINSCDVLPKSTKIILESFT